MRKAKVAVSISPHARLARPGRPRAAEIVDRNEYILRVASEVFLTSGFDRTSVDAIAASARISKRTLYNRYTDKATLFRAVLSDLIDRWLVPLHQFSSEEGDLEQTLLALAHYLVTFVLQPHSLNINRVVISEAQRWPEFGRLVTERARKPAIQVIKSILFRHRGRLRETDLELAAKHFMSLTVDSIMLSAHLGGVESASENVDVWVRASVKLFLGGLPHRD
ncbi:TetR/AcrR family transcriptional regulator [Bradyrhizobium sp. PUT101]|uniref:TetR/AcrR family transcriptional regulator n=1 Tax=Bradyrhizobium sp. PUT101 TaxID=3447427 RepID=UPI003F8301F1